MSDSWGFPEADASAFDKDVGPFPLPAFLNTWYEVLGEGDRVSVSSGDSFLPMVMAGGVVAIAGDPDVTDYHSPLGVNPASLVPALDELAKENKKVVLDSMPSASAKEIALAMDTAAMEYHIEEHESTAVIVVEGEYLDQLSKKQRHELRRKARRFEEALGSPSLVISEGDEAPFDRFVGMLGDAEGDKGLFLTAEREDFFRRLYLSSGWQMAELRSGGKAVASLFGQRSAGTFYLYNSAYDRSYADVSPGVVALHLLIERLVNEDCRRIDLLKGDEVYKSRMGAVTRPLYRIELR